MKLPWLSPVQDNSQGSSSVEAGVATHILARLHQLHTRKLFMQEDKQRTFSPETGTADPSEAACE